MAHHEITHSLTLDTADLVALLKQKGYEINSNAWVSHAQGKSGDEIVRFTAPKEFQFTICWTEAASVKD